MVPAFGGNLTTRAALMLYELTFALKPSRATENSKKVVGRVEELIEKADGKVEKNESLGVKTLAYPIQHLAQANFGRFFIQLNPGKVGELRRQLEREEELLRVFVV